MLKRRKEKFLILIVEDDEDDCLLIKEMFTRGTLCYGDLIFASRVDDAFKLLNNNHYDIILLDLGLPDANGLETVTQIHNKVPEIPIVILSGLEDEELAMESLKEGAQDYLVKGHVDSFWLARAIRYAIERHGLRFQLAEIIKERDRLLKELQCL